MDFDGDLYFAFAGAELPIEECELAPGLTLRRAYAHLMAPFVMAFNKPEPGKHHPAPWSAVNGGIAFDVEFVLETPRHYQPIVLDRLNTGWLVAALLRLKSGAPILCPVVLDTDLENCRTDPSQATIHALELAPRSMFANRGALTQDDLEWLRKNLTTAAQVLGASSNVLAALEACDAAVFLRSTSAMAAVWGAIEHLFSPPSGTELRFRVSAAIGSYLEPPGVPRLELIRRIQKLYGARSKVVHGTTSPPPNDLADSFMLLRRALIKIIEVGNPPSQSDLEEYMFSRG